MSRSAIDFKGLSLDRLETLSRVVRHGSITRAAGGVVSAQTQFSRQIGELEEYFGVELLDRSASPHQPTAVAAELAGLVDAFLADIGRLRQQAAGERPQVLIGAGDTAIRALLIPLAKPLIRRGIRVVLRNLTSRGVGAELKARRLDLGILHPDRVPAGCASRKLPAMGLALIVPASPAGPRSMRWADLAGRPIALLEGGGRLATAVREHALAAGVRLDVAIECSSSIQVIDAVRHCDCCGFVPELLKKHLPTGVAMVKLAGLADFQNDYAVAWHQGDRRRNPALDRVLAALLAE